MSATLTPEVYQDDIALSLAQIVAVANKRARELGVDVVQSLISITQQPTDICRAPASKSRLNVLLL